MGGSFLREEPSAAQQDVEGARAAAEYVLRRTLLGRVFIRLIVAERFRVGLGRVPRARRLPACAITTIAMSFVIVIVIVIVIVNLIHWPNTVREV